MASRLFPFKLGRRCKMSSRVAASAGLVWSKVLAIVPVHALHSWLERIVYRALHRSTNCRRDTIGTLAPLSIDIIALFPLDHCYGGAPREVPFATGQAAPQGAEVAPRTRDKTKECPVGAPSTPRSGAMQDEGRGCRRAPRDRISVLRDRENSSCSKRESCMTVW
jgi:hypothetical protein